VVFSSHLFLFGFLPLALLAYFAAPLRARNLVLTVASYAFYGWTNPAFVPLLLVSTAIDWYAGLVQATERWRVFPTGRGPSGPPVGSAPAGALRPLPAGGARSRTQRAALVLSVVSNLSLLGFFKYFHFALDSWNLAVASVGLPGAAIETALRVTLPLGISFYTFQSMSYAIDVYRGRAAPMRSFVDFACFVSMFPQLVAGPIIRFSEVADQLRGREPSLAKAARGAAFFAVGLAKKVLLANPCGKLADTVFDAASSTALDAWLGLLAYSFQIYFDFSGYSDMAIGLGLALGFVFPKNFDSPYRARSITEFWRRWHLSLSTWLRDYLYVPLGGNRKGARRTYVNLAAVMLLGGLWHGAAWTFVSWGALHGALLAAERAAGGGDRLWRFVPERLRVAWTFLLVTLAWVPFRAPDFAAALDFYARLLALAPAEASAALVSALVATPFLAGTLVVAAGVVWLAPQSWTWTRTLGPGQAIVALALFTLALAALATQRFNPFIYFIF
jgi:alginate O-acetyltransferase complex protein AlgI